MFESDHWLLRFVSLINTTNSSVSNNGIDLLTKFNDKSSSLILTLYLVFQNNPIKFSLRHRLPIELKSILKLERVSLDVACSSVGTLVDTRKSVSSNINSDMVVNDNEECTIGHIKFSKPVKPDTFSKLYAAP